MARLNIDYDLLTWEGDILRLQFWARAFEVLKAKRRRLPADRGQARGLLGDEASTTTATAPAEARGAGPTTNRRDERRAAREGHRAIERHRHLRRQGHGLPVLEVRAARPRLPLPPVRDAAGRRRALGHDERSGAGRDGRIRRSARAAATYNVIDVAAGLPAEAAEAGARARSATRPRPSDSTHFSYEMVALSHATARELGLRAAAGSDEAKRPFVEVSGRKGQASRPTTCSIG